MKDRQVTKANFVLLHFDLLKCAVWEIKTLTLKKKIKKIGGLEEEGREIRKKYCWRDWLLFDKATQVSEGEI